MKVGPTFRLQRPFISHGARRNSCQELNYNHPRGLLRTRQDILPPTVSYGGLVSVVMVWGDIRRCAFGGSSDNGTSPSARAVESPAAFRNPPQTLRALAHVAGCTERVRLATNSVNLPYRNAATTPEQLATRDVLS